ncbi:MAG: Na+/H+ antiporter subunit E [Actinobacteria bacterium]|nr:Na+/H+ antiporter subunit E [Actinomycetota bacterium]
MSFLLTAVVMFIFWMLLSGEFSFILILSGVISSLLVSYLSHDLLVGNADIKLSALRIYRFVKYLPWLMWQIVLANFDLAYRTLHPRMPIDPGIITFKNEFKTELGMVTLANSITLTPGTVTIEVNKNEFIIHAIAKGPAESLMAGEMEQRVKNIEGCG